jgi:hypothetical protein
MPILTWGLRGKEGSGAGGVINPQVSACIRPGSAQYISWLCLFIIKKTTSNQVCDSDGLAL